MISGLVLILTVVTAIPLVAIIGATVLAVKDSL